MMGYEKAAWLSAISALSGSVQQCIAQLQKDNVPLRLDQHDPTLWAQDPQTLTEIRQRLGWLSPSLVSGTLSGLASFINGCAGDGLTHAILLGMGGSSLAPEVMALTFQRGRHKPAGLKLSILDSTDPAEVLAAFRRSPIERTLVVVASKSGATSEVSAFLAYFWERAIRKLGNKAGDHFVAITDPGTTLETLAYERRFRKVFLADPTVGGRFSALTVFGLLPAALMGLDAKELLARGQSMAALCSPDMPIDENPGLVLGAVLGQAALNGRDKLTILTDPEIRSFGSWLEQLIAESTGKQGKGIIPIDLEPPVAPAAYGRDRLFVYFRLSGKRAPEVDRLLKVGHPVITIALKDRYDLGAEFFRWEYATAVACAILGVNGFDQPDVQDNKDRTKQKIQAWLQHRVLEEGVPIWVSTGAKVYGTPLPTTGQLNSLTDVLEVFLQQAADGEYIAINAYLPRHQRTVCQLQTFRLRILHKTGCATTLGFGPRFLHSTGQLHKGGPDTGLFIQITHDPPRDLEIPGQKMGFGTLQRAQALGDLDALLSRSRRVIRIHLLSDGLGALSF